MQMRNQNSHIRQTPTGNDSRLKVINEIMNNIIEIKKSRH